MEPIELEIVRGHVGYYDIAVTLPAGDLSGCVLNWAAKRSYLDALPAISKNSAGGGISIADPATKTAQLKITATDTEGIEAPAMLHWDLQLVDSLGERYPLASGRLFVRGSALA